MTIPQTAWEWWETLALRLFEFLLIPLEYLLSMFPDIDPYVSLSSIDQFAVYLNWVGKLLDLNTFVFVVGVIVTYEVIMISVRIILFIYRLLPLT